MPILKILLTAAIFLNITACSTLFNNNNQSLMLIPSNNEQDIKVNISGPDGSYITNLPATIVSSTSSFDDLTVTVTDSCYHTTVSNISKSITPSYWINIITVYGFLIDWATGAMWDYDNNNFVIVNKKENCPPAVAAE